MAEGKSGAAGLALWARAQVFQHLMRRRVEDILLVSSLYDSFILAEDGQLNELMLSEFLELNLRHTPGLTRVSSGAQAVALAREEPRFNLIITSMHLGDMDALALARRVKEAGLDVPVILLAYDSRELGEFMKRNDVSDIDRVFLWQGDVRILLAIVKYVEDRMNVAHDSGVMGVQVILVVEDNVRFYSSFLPVIYTEIMAHSHSLVPEGINLSHKLMRIQARPKILLCSTYEEAWSCFEAYRENVLGIIADIEFPKEGRLDREAGAELARRVREVQPDIPIMLQSSHRENAFLAREAGAAFLIKGSPTFLQQLRRFMVENFSFGDFVFRLPDGTAVDRAHDLKELEEKLRTVPAESLGHHGERNHFSNWLKARTEFLLAHRLRPRKVSDFATLEELRADLIRSIQEYRHDLKQGIVADFERGSFDPESGFSRIGGGSLGGKARGLAFVNLLLTEHGARDRFPGVRVSVPPSVVLATDVFDRFMEANGLGDFALNAADDEEVLRRFLEAEFPPAYREDLGAFLTRVTYPLAVRSSSLLEDSQYQPFAGIYETYMLPNNHPDPEVRLGQLIDAIKRVYASTFSTRAKTYLGTTPYRLEEEKMAVILQKVVGAVHGDRFYPDFAGVARSYNFYPTAPMTTEDGIAAVALGLGETVVDGEACIRFCPRYPRHLVQFSSVRDVLQNSQREFYALTLKDSGSEEGHPAFELRRLGLEAAEEDGTLSLLGSTYSPENDAVYDGISRPGVRLVSFAPILKHRLFPLAEILDALLEIGKDGTSTPVEIEFAVRLATPPAEPKEFGFLQLRPLALSREMVELAIGGEDPASLLCASPAVLGHGKIDDLRDVVVVDYHRFDRGRSRDVAREVARMNASLSAAGLPYLLVGVGRWGSADPFLGIPVSWDQIASARVIVESGFKDFKVTPSQGTHFFQNITSSRVGYFTVNPDVSEGFVDWDWLSSQPAVEETEFVRHLRFRAPVVVKMNGKRNEGVILKPADR
jgi:CheY-like chemotaxis protein